MSIPPYIDCELDTFPLVEIPRKRTVVEPLVEFASGAALGSESKIVAVSSEGTSSTGTFKAVAATERFVQ